MYVNSTRHLAFGTSSTGAVQLPLDQWIQIAVTVDASSNVNRVFYNKAMILQSPCNGVDGSCSIATSLTLFAVF